ncbi:MAG: DUF2959 domain-containing protein [Pseudomonadota bacterium]
MKTLIQSLGVVGLALVLVGCESAYYSAWEQFGVHKRDLLVDRVEDAMESQEEAKQQFKSALEQFASVVQIEDSNLKSMYEELNDEFESAKDRADAVTGRIDAVEDVSEDLFDEWRGELEQYSSASLRRSSETQLRDTERKYEQLLSSMRRAESRMQPVLDVFQDQVLFLKHNLNAQAVSSLKSELAGIESDVGRLIADMEDSISRSQSFIDDLEAGA